MGWLLFAAFKHRPSMLGSLGKANVLSTACPSATAVHRRRQGSDAIADAEVAQVRPLPVRQ
jgi:hypothetical protein